MLRRPLLLPLSLLACALTSACSGGADEDTTSTSSSSSSSSSGSSAAPVSQGASASSSRGGSSSASQGAGSSSGGAGSCQQVGASSDMMGSSSSEAAGECDGHLFGYPVLLVCDYGNAAAGSRVVVGVLGDHVVTERTQGQADVQTTGNSDTSTIGGLIYQASGTELVSSLDVQSPNEQRRGTIVGCEGTQERIMRWEGPDPDTGYWLVARNPSTEAEQLRQLCNALTQVDTPQ